MLAGGCDFIFRLDPLDDPRDADGDSGVSPACAAPVLHDPFDGPAFCAPWGTSYMDNGATIKEAGALEITPAPQLDSVGGCVMPTARPFGNGVTAVVTEVVLGTSTYTVLQIHGPELQIKASGDGMLRFQTSASQDIGIPVVYRPTMKWWRIRPASSAIIGEYSEDGVAWVTLGSAPILAPTNISVELAVGTNTTLTMGTGKFDDLLICP